MLSIFDYIVSSIELLECSLRLLTFQSDNTISASYA